MGALRIVFLIEKHKEARRSLALTVKWTPEDFPFKLTELFSTKRGVNRNIVLGKDSGETSPSISLPKLSLSFS